MPDFSSSFGITKDGEPTSMHLYCLRFLIFVFVLIFVFFFADIDIQVVEDWANDIPGPETSKEFKSIL